MLGLGIGLAFAAMANLVVDAAPQEMTGVASGVNTIVRSIGGAIGGQVAAAILTASASASGLPGESGYTNAFLMSGVGAIIALGAASLVPKPGVGDRSIETSLSASELEAFDEAAVFAGAYGASDVLPPSSAESAR